MITEDVCIKKVIKVIDSMTCILHIDTTKRYMDLYFKHYGNRDKRVIEIYFKRKVKELKA